MKSKQLTSEVRELKKIAGLLKESHGDKEWDEEDDKEDNGQDYPSDEELFGLSEKTEDSIKEWGALDPEDYNSLEMQSRLQKLKGLGKINDLNFKKAEEFIFKNSYDLYYDFRTPDDALKYVLKNIKKK